MRSSKKTRTKRKAPPKKRLRGGKFDIQNWIAKFGVEFHPYSLSKKKRYQFFGLGTFLKKRWIEGIRASIIWIALPDCMTLTTLRPRVYRINGKPTIRW